MLQRWKHLSLMSLFTPAVLAISVPGNGAEVLLTPERAEAYSLAIQHFDPLHAVGLAIGGEETQFVLEALRLCRAKIPEIAMLHNPIYYADASALGPYELKTLSLRSNRSGYRDEYNPIFQVFGGCEKIEPHEGTQVARSVYGGPWRSYRLCDTIGEAPAKSACGNARLAEWLCSRGVTQVSITCIDDPDTCRFPNICLNFATPGDMALAAREIGAEPQFQELLPGYTLGRYYARPRLIMGEFGNPIPDELMHIQTRPDVAHSGTSGIVLVFTFKTAERFLEELWAPPHLWEIVVGNEGGNSPHTWRLTVESAVERGNPIADAKAVDFGE